LRRSFDLGFILAVATDVTAAPFPYAVGGNGSSTVPAVGQVFYAGATAWQSRATTSVTCGSGTSCTSFDVLGNSPITITASGGSAFPFTPTTNFGQIANATTTAIWFQGTPFSLFASSTSVFSYASTTALTVTGSTYLSSITSALTLTGSDGLVAEYAGTSCTNQFVRSLSALGAATCATVSAGDVSLANLTATDSTLTFSGTYNGSTARTIGINLGNANTWTALQTINNASTTNLTANLTNIVGDGSGASFMTPTRGWSFTYGTSTWTGTTTVLYIVAFPFSTKTNTVACKTDTGTVNVQLQYGTGPTLMPMTSASSTLSTKSFASNNTPAANNLIAVTVGTPASSPTEVHCTGSGPQTSI